MISIIYNDDSVELSEFVPSQEFVPSNILRPPETLYGPHAGLAFLAHSEQP